MAHLRSNKGIPTLLDYLEIAMIAAPATSTVGWVALVHMKQNGVQSGQVNDTLEFGEF